MLKFIQAHKFLTILIVLIGSAGLYKGVRLARHYVYQQGWIYYHERDSQLAHNLLDDLKGVEIGASAQNPFNLPNSLNVDYTDDLTTPFKQCEIKFTGTCAKVDIIASGDKLPLDDNSVDYVLNSHVIEHFYDPISTIQEWLRVVRPGGYVFMIIPHKDRTFDREKTRTTLAELIERHERPNPPDPMHHDHHSFWITEDVEELCRHMGWNVVAMQEVDDKVGNGFTIVIQK